jgi:hypothetical protein
MLDIISEDLMRELLEGKSERSDLEFKPPFIWGVKREKADGNIVVQEKVIRGVIGLNHHSLGGVLVIGIEEGDNHQPIIKGVNAEQLEPFQDTEGLRGVIDGFASEKINYTLGTGKFPDASDQLVDLIVIQVEQFPRYISLCAHNGQTKFLREGALYIRPTKGRPRTEEVTPADFRELQDMAIDNLQKHLETRGWVWRETSNNATSRIADLEGIESE